MEYKFKFGDRVRHQDGTLGEVTKDEDANGLVNWKDVRGYRVSDKSALKIDTTKFRWRNQ